MKQLIEDQNKAKLQNQLEMEQMQERLMTAQNTSSTSDPSTDESMMSKEQHKQMMDLAKKQLEQLQSESDQVKSGMTDQIETLTQALDLVKAERNRKESELDEALIKVEELKLEVAEATEKFQRDIAEKDAALKELSEQVKSNQGAMNKEAEESFQKQLLEST